MCWAIALLSTVLFTFSLLFVQALTDHVKADERWNDDMMYYWGSTRMAMITLFQASTGGEDWARVAEPLWDLGWVYYMAFMLYICFFLFIIVNILTALFVDAALDRSIKDDQMVIREEMQHKQEYIQHIQALYRRLNHGGLGELSWDEFSQGLQSPDMLAFASALDIEISDIHEFFRLISSEGRGVVDIDSFVVGCMKLKGSAKNLDVVSLLHRARHLEQLTSTFAVQTDGHLHEVTRLLGRVLSEQERNKETLRGQLSREHSAIPDGPWNVACTPRPRRYSLLAPEFDVPHDDVC